ncbi:MAG: antibiotic biosynthesis monooxygenase [Myxococcales bacterium]|nr:antibiotic biosynthesis monooxygenase [Myxococcales bacterium]
MKNVEYIHYDVKDAARISGFCEAFRKGLTHLQKDPTVLDCELVQDCDDSGKFVVRIVWEDRESQKTYTQKDDFKVFMGMVGAFNDAFVSMKFHDPIELSA